ncbi:hypothetical protein [uncultured phage]|nr:hypothetical protein [uncultured phage]
MLAPIFCSDSFKLACKGFVKSLLAKAINPRATKALRAILRATKAPLAIALLANKVSNTPPKLLALVAAVHIAPLIPLKVNHSLLSKGTKNICPNTISCSNIKVKAVSSKTPLGIDLKRLPNVFPIDCIGLTAFSQL